MKEVLEKYIQKYCINCKNRKKEDLCEICISVVDNMVIAKCKNYEGNDE